MRQLLCALLGGHDLGLPKVIDGRVRLACQFNCGYATNGIETRGQERARERAHERRVVYLNLIQVRDRRRRVA